MAKLNDRLLQLEWLFHERGLDAVWNELRKFAQMTLVTTAGNWQTIPAGIVKYGDIDLANTTYSTATSGIPNTTPPIPPGANLPGWGGTSFATAPQGPPNITNQPNTSGGENTGEPRVPTLNEP